MSKIIAFFLLLVTTPISAQVLFYQSGVPMTAPTDAVFDQTGKYLYVSSLNQTANQLRVFESDDAGQLTERFSISDPALVSPWSLAIYGEDLYVIVYGATGVADGALLHYKIAASGSIITPAVSSFTLDKPSDLVLSSSGDQLYVRTEGVGGGTGSLIVYNRDEVNGAISQLQVIGGQEGAGRIAVSGDDSYIYVSSDSLSRIQLFQRDPVAGELTLIESYLDGQSSFDDLGGVLPLVLSKDGAYLYTGNSTESSVSVLSVERSTGRLSPGQVYVQGDLSRIGNLERPITGIAQPIDIELSEDGQALYVVGFDSTGSGTPLTDLTLFRIDTVDGGLAYVETYKSDSVMGMLGALRLAISPASPSLYTMGLLDDNLAHFSHATTNLAVSVVDDVDPVGPGLTVNYEFTVSNSSNSSEGVKLHYPIPNGATLLNVDNTDCRLSASSVECELGEIAAGAHNAVHIDMTLTAPTTTGVMSNRPVVLSPNLDNDIDDNGFLEETLVSDFVNTIPTGVADRIDVFPGQVTMYDVIENDIDPDGQTLSIVDGSVQPLTPATEGVLTKIDSARVSYTPPATVAGVPFTGYAHFTYQVTDDNDSSSDTDIVVIVNTPPTATDDTATVVNGNSVNVLVLVNDTDADGDLLTIHSIDASGLRGGGAVLETDNTITYTADSDFVGSDQLTYTIVDNKEGYSTATLSITSRIDEDTQGGNNPPSIASGSSGGGGSLGIFFILSLMYYLRFKSSSFRFDSSESV